MQKNQNSSTQRKLKVYGRTVGRGNRLKQIPEIRLMGRWLNQMGYVPGQTVSVNQQGQTLTITVVPNA